jgi:phospholipid/cholesterol/gamma-HCH transport system permease protein
MYGAVTKGTPRLRPAQNTLPAADEQLQGGRSPAVRSLWLDDGPRNASAALRRPTRARTYHRAMSPPAPRPHAPADLGRTTLRWFTGWWRIIHLGAVLLVLSLSPSSYREPNRTAMAGHIAVGTAPTLLWFTLLSSLISLVLIRIVVVTAASYGLSQYALQMVVRVLVLELIPLTAAVFVALRISLPDGREIARMRARGELDALRATGIDPVRHEVLPRVMAGVFSVLMLAAVAGVVTLVLAYLTVYGFTSEGFDRYTRTVGQVFSPAVSLIFTIKTFLLSVAVALMPVASALYDLPRTRSRTSAELQALVRLFLVMLLIEAASLVGNYY